MHTPPENGMTDQLCFADSMAGFALIRDRWDDHTLRDYLEP